MGSSRTGQDASLGTGISLPQWIKGRVDTRYDFDQASFSPPSHDDNFFCIRYSAKAAESGDNSTSSGYRPISQVLSENKKSSETIVGSSVNNSNVAGTSSNIKDNKRDIDYSKHTLPCQPFIPATGGKETKPMNGGLSNKYKVTKSLGTDDGFHGEPALCGKSIVHVASRMMSRKLVKAEQATEAMEMPNKSESSAAAEQRHYLEEQLLRKGSKSLPVTPIASPMSTPDTSPKSRRRVNANRYFTGAFVPDRDNKYQAGWLLSSILGQSRDVMGANTNIQEVDETGSPPNRDIVVPSRFLNRKKSISSQNLSYLGSSDQQNLHPHNEDDESEKQTAVFKNVFQAKPSELREMNFWSPTSM